MLLPYLKVAQFGPKSLAHFDLKSLVNFASFYTAVALDILVSI